MRDVDYCGDPNEVAVFDAVPAALHRLKAAGYKVIVITNQSGIGRGYFNEKAYRAVEAEVERQIGAGLIDATYFCPHSLPTRANVANPNRAWCSRRLASIPSTLRVRISSGTRRAMLNADVVPEQKRFSSGPAMVVTLMKRRRMPWHLILLLRFESFLNRARTSHSFFRPSGSRAEWTPQRGVPALPVTRGARK